jgi:hypothetical protein
MRLLAGRGAADVTVETATIGRLASFEPIEPRPQHRCTLRR